MSRSVRRASRRACLREPGLIPGLRSEWPRGKARRNVRSVRPGTCPRSVQGECPHSSPPKARGGVEEETARPRARARDAWRKTAARDRSAGSHAVEPAAERQARRGWPRPMKTSRPRTGAYRLSRAAILTGKTTRTIRPKNQNKPPTDRTEAPAEAAAQRALRPIRTKSVPLPRAARLAPRVGAWALQVPSSAWAARVRPPDKCRAKVRSSATRPLCELRCHSK